MIWNVEIPRPPSLNEMIGVNRYVLATRKKTYVESVRWLLKHAIGGSNLPLRTKVVVRWVVFGEWRGGGPDDDNWSKWVKDAIGGFVTYDDRNEFLDFERPHLMRGKPTAILSIEDTGEPVRIPERRKPKIPRRTRRARIRA